MEKAMWIFIPILIYGLVRLYFTIRKRNTPILYCYLMGMSAVASPFFAPSCLCTEPERIFFGALLYFMTFNVVVVITGFLVLFTVKKLRVI